MLPRLAMPVSTTIATAVTDLNVGQQQAVRARRMPEGALATTQSHAC